MSFRTRSRTSRNSRLSCLRPSRTGAVRRSRQSLVLNSPVCEYDVNNFTSCESGPNFYDRLFGPTADESILVSLQTLISLCNRCPQEKTPSTSEESLEEIEEEEEGDCFRIDVKDLEDNETQTDTYACSYCRANNCVQTERPCVKPGCVQTREVSPVQPQLTCDCCEPISAPPCCCATVSKSAQYSKPPSRSAKTSTKAASDICCCCVGSTDVDDGSTSCSCRSCLSKSTRRVKKSRRSIKRSREFPVEVTVSPRCTCCSSSSKPQKQVTLCCECPSNSSSGFDDTEMAEEGSGQMTPSQMGDANGVTVRYAITKISKYFSYTTFEVMKSTSKRPKVMPKSLEGVFVLKNSPCKR
ncbi:hypothetical protein NQ317_015770 [Molorchus minor]|uniref:Uncharacterized protein n=1 Tax=Molorchus minor TaxID=1323400 RepID=A0ABQ9K2W0_9CUCU|nr:hypothetical protein NQ317_015770 [Molorchus minor]